MQGKYAELEHEDIIDFMSTLSTYSVDGRYPGLDIDLTELKDHVGQANQYLPVIKNIILTMLATS